MPIIGPCDTTPTAVFSTLSEKINLMVCCNCRLTMYRGRETIASAIVRLMKYIGVDVNVRLTASNGKQSAVSLN